MALNKKELEDLVKRISLEYVVINLAKVVYVQAGLTDDHFKELRKNAREKLFNETFAGIEPTFADHFSAELADEVDSLYGAIETEVKKLRKLANQQNDDP